MTRLPIADGALMCDDYGDGYGDGLWNCGGDGYGDGDETGMGTGYGMYNYDRVYTAYQHSRLSQWVALLANVDTQDAECTIVAMLTRDAIKAI